MPNLTRELDELRKEDPDVATLIDFYGEVERIYQETLEAMGVTTGPQQEATRSSDVSISFQNTSSTSYHVG